MHSTPCSWTSDLQHHIRCTNKKHSTSVDPDGVHEKRCVYPGEPFHEFWKRGCLANHYAKFQIDNFQIEN